MGCKGEVGRNNLMNPKAMYKFTSKYKIGGECRVEGRHTEASVWNSSNDCVIILFAFSNQKFPGIYLQLKL